MRFNSVPPRTPQAIPEVRIKHESLKGVGKIEDAHLRHKQTGLIMYNHLRDVAYGEGHNGQSHAHGLGQNIAEPFPQRRQSKNVDGSVELFHLFDKADKLYAITDAKTYGLCLEISFKLTDASQQDGALMPHAPQNGNSFQQITVSFLFRESPGAPDHDSPRLLRDQRLGGRCIEKRKVQSIMDHKRSVYGYQIRTFGKDHTPGMFGVAEQFRQDMPE